MASALVILSALGTTLAAAQVDREPPKTPDGIERPDYEPPGGTDEPKIVPFDDCGPTCLHFPIHIVVLTDNPNVDMSEARAREEVGILNQYFVTSKGRRPVRFYYKSHRLHGEIREVPREVCELAYVANGQPYGDGAAFENAFGDCGSSDLRDPNAINVYVYDDFVWRTSERETFTAQKPGSKPMTTRPKPGSKESSQLKSAKDTSPRGGHGRKNGYMPYILLDFERLPHVQAAEEHEMGHAFGLDHICYPTAKSNSDTNIMASANKYNTTDGKTADCAGSGGKRNLGFTDEQSATILETAERIYEALGSPERPRIRELSQTRQIKGKPGGGANRD